MTAAGGSGSGRRCDTLVLVGLQALLVGMPLGRGGAHVQVQTIGAAVAVCLLGLWLYKSLRMGTAGGAGPARAPIAALLAFSALVIFQTVPLSPAALHLLSPRAHALFAELLPGWPDAGDWSAWRPLALEPFAAQMGLLEFSVPFAVFAILAGYPWNDGAAQGDVRRAVFGRLVATLLVSASVIALAALVPQRLRATGPYANANHLAGYLEMLIPLATVYLGIVASGLWRRLALRAQVGRGWGGALVDMQEHLIAPLIGLAALGLMLLAHRATDSRGGLVSLVAAAMLCGVGLLRRAASRLQGGMAVRRAGTAALVAAVVGLAVAGQLLIGSAEDARAGRSIEEHLRIRLLVIPQARPLLGEFPLLGVGLGSWIHAFRLHQAPPIETTVWTHAHNDYLQLLVETGLLGTLILLWFAWSVVRAASGAPGAGPCESPSSVRRHRTRNGGADALARTWDFSAVAHGSVPAATRAIDPAAATHAPGAAGNERPAAGDDGWSALRRWELLRIGLGAGVGALMIHGLSDFNFRVPANALLFMTLLGLLILSAPPRTGSSRFSSWTPAALLAVVVFAAAGPALHLAPFSVGGSVWARSQVEAAHRPGMFADDAVALARRAVELAPLAPEAHEALGAVLDDPLAGEAAYRRAIRLSPDAARLRDLLAFRMWDRGDQAGALRQLEESVAEAPDLAAHASYLTQGDGSEPTALLSRPAALPSADSLAAWLGRLHGDMQAAIERGLQRGLQAVTTADRRGIVVDLATVLEVRGRHREAGILLEEWNGRLRPNDGLLTRAAVNYVEAGDYGAAERVLREQISHTPDDGELYRLLAVKVHAATGDFANADRVLDAGRHRSAALLPIYRGIRTVLTLRQ